MLSARARALLGRYALASSALSPLSGERLSRQPGQSLEYLDVRPYGPGDELRYVDWQVYARTRRLYTRLYRAERSTVVHILLDTSSSMALGAKLAFAKRTAALLAYAAQGGVTQVHLLSGRASSPAHSRADLLTLWRFIEAAPVLPGTEVSPSAALRGFSARPGLLVVLSDLLDEAPLTGALAALKARGFDASFVQLLAQGELEPEPAQLELSDVETGGKLEVSPAEVRLYREAVQAFLARSRAQVRGAGFRYSFLTAPEPATAQDAGEQSALSALIRAGVLVKR